MSAIFRILITYGMICGFIWKNRKMIFVRQHYTYVYSIIIIIDVIFYIEIQFFRVRKWLTVVVDQLSAVWLTSY